MGEIGHLRRVTVLVLVVGLFVTFDQIIPRNFCADKNIEDVRHGEDASMTFGRPEERPWRIPADAPTKFRNDVFDLVWY